MSFLFLPPSFSAPLLAFVPLDSRYEAAIYIYSLVLEALRDELAQSYYALLLTLYTRYPVPPDRVPLVAARYDQSSNFQYLLATPGGAIFVVQG